MKMVGRTVREIKISAVVARADGKKQDLGVISHAKTPGEVDAMQARGGGFMRRLIDGFIRHQHGHR